MGNLTKNFSRWEFKCKCNACNLDTIDFEVLKNLQEACNYLASINGLPKVTCGILSGFRCKWWNGHEGGVFNSLHTSGKAIDFRILELDTYTVYKYLNATYKSEQWEIIYDGTKDYIHFGRK